jgi:hypothetical protein
VQDELVAFRFGPILWPDEVWQFDLWAKRTSQAPYAADELIVLDDIRVPPLGETNRLDRTFQRLGLEVRIESFAHKPPPEPGGYSMADVSHLRVTVSELPEGHYLDLVRVADEQGRTLQSMGWSRSHSKPVEQVFAVRQVPEGAQLLSVRLTVQRGRPFSFLVQPELAGANGFRQFAPVKGEHR